MTLGEFQKSTWAKLESLYGLGEARAITALLVEGKLGWSSTEISFKRGDTLLEEQLALLQPATQRLLLHEPVQYVTGIAYFWELEFQVTPDVLIPRQETEELVDWILKENLEVGLSLLDIGTGSGCIPISLALEMKHANISALDYSAAALRVAQQNAATHHASIAFHQQDILQASPTDFSDLDIIVSNPPYIRNSEKQEMMPHVLDHEPGEALFVPNNDPLLFYRTIAELGHHWLQKGGKLYVEINEAFGKEVVALLKELKYEEVELRKDLNGKDRMVRGRRSFEF